MKTNIIMCEMKRGKDMPNFKDIYGQEQIVDHLENAIASGKISHAYIINGERSSGKEFIANVFAMALQCESTGQEKPCNECHSCKQALSGNHPDIIRVTHEKPATIGVEDIRTGVNDDIIIKPYSSDWKIYIISEAEKMTVQAQNALLKTLEEPPAYAVIILLTSNIDSMLSTILSRCVVLNMKPVKDEIIKKYLMEEMKETELTPVWMAYRIIRQMSVPPLQEAISAKPRRLLPVKNLTISKQKLSVCSNISTIWKLRILCQRSKRSMTIK